MTDDDIGNVIEKIIRSHVHEELRDWMYRSLVSDLGEGEEEMAQRASKADGRVQYDFTGSPYLQPQHAARMYEAGIHPLVAKHRGYASVGNLGEADALGISDEFSASQLTGLPALSI